MFVVKRPFKSFGKFYTAGTVITEPAAIKRFKGKVAEGKIIVVTEQTYEATAKYFKAKHKVELPPFTDENIEEETKPEEVTEEVTETKPEEVTEEVTETKPEEVKPVKAAAKAKAVSK